MTRILSRGLISPITRTSDHAKIVVEPRIDDQRLQLVGVARRGGGMRDDGFSTACTFWPVLALMAMASEASMPITASISALARSVSAVGKSILLSTGITSRPCSTAVTAGHRLGFHALGGVDHEQSPSQAASERLTS